MTEKTDIHALLLNEELDSDSDGLGDDEDGIEIDESDDFIGEEDDGNNEEDEFSDDDDDDDLDDDDEDDFDGDDIVINDEDFDDDEIYYEDETESSEATATEPSEEDTKFKDLYMRKCADLENFKKRAEKERRDILRFGNEGLIREVLTVVDNLERALEHINDESMEDDASDSLKEGVELTVKNLFAILTKFGLEEIKADGEQFDPTKHQAISHEESDEHESGAVVKELQRGYFLKERLLRPSLVIVAK